MSTVANTIYLLDTGVANQAALANSVIRARLGQIHGFYIPEVVIGELYYGAYWHAYLHQSTRYLDAYDAFFQRYGGSILYGTEETGHLYGAIYAELRSKGQLIQQNDVWIAALARQYGYTVATVDKDFERVSNLLVEIW